MASAAAPAAGDARRKTACVTGGSGYIASELIKMLLQNGYAVKTTVRHPEDTEKNAHLKVLQELGPLEVFRADLDEEGSFDDAVAGCDYAFLVAAPVALMPQNPEKEVIEPAVRGTVNVLRSCAKAGTMKRVVLTSSTAAVSSRPLEGDGHVLGEESWSDVDWLRANKIGTWIFLAENQASSGRYVCCSLNTTAIELARFLAAKYPQYKIKTDRIGHLPEKPRVRISSGKLADEGFEYRYKNLDEIYDDVVVYGRALGILPY